MSVGIREGLDTSVDLSRSCPRTAMYVRGDGFVLGYSGSTQARGAEGYVRDKRGLAADMPGKRG